MRAVVSRQSSVVNFCKAVILPLPRLHRSRALSEVEGEGGLPRVRTSAGNPSRRILVLISSMLLVATSGCGYHVGGQAAALPSDVRSIAIPAFENRTTSYRLEQVLTSAVVREFTSRTNYHIAHSADAADATLRGTVTSAQISPLTYDSQTGRLSSALVTVNMSVSLASRDGKKLYDNPNYSFRQQYEVSRELSSFFQEESPAVDRLSRDFARTLVSNILENY